MTELELRSEMMDVVLKNLEESSQVKDDLAISGAESIVRAAELMIKSLKAGGKILFCGNGGSAADSQHLATELLSKLKLERGAIPALALTTNTSILTAIANDYDFANIFVRQVEAFGSEGDILVGISTSGNSGNVIKAMEYAQENKIKTVGLTGGNSGRLPEYSDVVIIVPSQDVQRIQEAHITVGHILCDLIEQALFGR